MSKVIGRTQNVTPLPRTEHERRCVHSARDSMPVRTDDSAQDGVVVQSLRTEQVPTASAPLGPDGASRVLTAGLLNAALAERWEAGEEWASNRCIAERYCGLTESVVRRWRDGEKLIPLAALHVQHFRAEMGPRPSKGHSIDRIDPAGNYEPGNCRWATKIEQGRNTRRKAYVVVGGAPMRIFEAAAKLGVSVNAVQHRVKRGVLKKFAIDCDNALRDATPEAAPFCAGVQGSGT